MILKAAFLGIHEKIPVLSNFIDCGKGCFLGQSHTLANWNGWYFFLKIGIYPPSDFHVVEI